MLARGHSPSPRTMDLRCHRLVTAFVILEQWGKTPHDLGYTWDEIDPCYMRAMLIIKGAVEQQRRLQR